MVMLDWQRQGMVVAVEVLLGVVPEQVEVELVREVAWLALPAVHDWLNILPIAHLTVPLAMLGSEKLQQPGFQGRFLCMMLVPLPMVRSVAAPPHV